MRCRCVFRRSCTRSSGRRSSAVFEPQMKHRSNTDMERRAKATKIKSPSSASRPSRDTFKKSLSTKQTLDLLRSYESRNVLFINPEGSWPIVWERARGVHVWDAGGKQYL